MTWARKDLPEAERFAEPSRAAWILKSAVNRQRIGYGSSSPVSAPKKASAISFGF